MRMSLRVAAAWVAVLAGTSGLPGGATAGTVPATSWPQHLQLPKGIPEVEQAIAQFKAKDLERCQALLKSAVAAHPELPPARVLFAKLCLVSDRPALGRAALERAVVEDPEDPEAHLIFGWIALQEKRFADAHLQFDRARQCATSGSRNEARRREFLTVAYSGLADAAEQRGDWPGTASALDAMLKLGPDNGPARRRLGIARFHQGRRDEALAELQQAARLDPSLDPPAVILGWLYTEAGDLAKAAEWMEYGVNLAPDDARAHLGYAAWLLDRDRTDQAKLEAEAAARLSPGSTDARSLLGYIARYRGDHAAAEQVFRDLHVENPGNFTASNLWALSLAESPSEGPRARALQVAALNLQLYPNSIEAQTTFGWAAFRNGDIERAEQALRKAMAGGPANPETAYDLARVLADRGKDGEVHDLLKLSLGSPGRFASRADARRRLEGMEKPADRSAPPTGPE